MDPIVIDLPDVLGEIALVLEVLGQRHHTGHRLTKMGGQIPDAQIIKADKLLALKCCAELSLEPSMPSEEKGVKMMSLFSGAF